MDFANDMEKMVDYWKLTKEEFLFSYSYLTEEEYEATRKIVGDRNNMVAKLNDLIRRAGLSRESIYVWSNVDSTLGIAVEGEAWSSRIRPEDAECEVMCLVRGYLIGKTIA